MEPGVFIFLKPFASKFWSLSWEGFWTQGCCPPESRNLARKAIFRETTKRPEVTLTELSDLQSVHRITIRAGLQERLSLKTKAEMRWCSGQMRQRLIFLPSRTTQQYKQFEFTKSAFQTQWLHPNSAVASFEGQILKANYVRAMRRKLSKFKRLYKWGLQIRIFPPIWGIQTAYPSQTTPS